MCSHAILAAMPDCTRKPTLTSRTRTCAAAACSRAPILRRSPLVVTLAITIAALVAGCAGLGEKEMEVSKDTYACKLQGQRLVVRFTEQEARLLMPPDERLVTLYQVSTGTGVRYTNGMMDLRGAGTDLTLTRDNFAVALTGCEPLKVPKKSGNPFLLN
jgi:membrane-bound inhibitor of C-type lysozyme